MKKLRTIIAATAISAPLLTAFGCADNANKPYSLTGEQSLTADQQRWADQHSVDQKGHYNPTLHQQAVDQVRQADQRAQ